jgi:hypothetical protein
MRADQENTIGDGNSKGCYQYRGQSFHYFR